GASLPLHLCGAAVILSAIMLVNKSYALYEIVYFWGLGGAIQALLTPDIGVYAFPHYRFFQFFVSHGSIVTASIFMTFDMNYRPKLRSIPKIFLITNCYMIFIAIFNYFTNGNYLFICHKPETASLIDVLGPWPWYILSLEVVGIISFYIYYSPFAIKDYFVRSRVGKK
ncbi:MAG: TIGR02206 family membrane protein, partial [Candidatus Neomarinimicrobiota bacterium]